VRSLVDRNVSKLTVLKLTAYDCVTRAADDAHVESVAYTVPITAFTCAELIKPEISWIK
jgi:hypothetical protein